MAESCPSETTAWTFQIFLDDRQKKLYIFLWLLYLVLPHAASRAVLNERVVMQQRKHPDVVCHHKHTGNRCMVALKSNKMERKVVASSILKTATHFRLWSSGSDGAEIKLIKVNVSTDVEFVKTLKLKHQKCYTVGIWIFCLWIQFLQFSETLI